MSKLKLVTLTLVAALAATVLTSSARAQGYNSGGSFGGPSSLQYNPRPTVSPYLQLYNNPSAYGSYYLNVLPLLQQNAFYSQQSNFNTEQQAAVNQLQAQLGQVRSTSGLGVTGTAARINATGHPAEYLYYSHYYTLGRH